MTTGGSPRRERWKRCCRFRDRPLDKEARQRIDITHPEAQALIQRGEDHCFDSRDYAIAVAIIRNYFALGHAYQEKAYTIQRLLNRFFPRTEKAQRVLKKAGPHEDAPLPPEAAEKESPPEKPKGHGRNGAATYTGARKVSIPLPQGQALFPGGSRGGSPDRGSAAFGSHRL